MSVIAHYVCPQCGCADMHETAKVEALRDEAKQHKDAYLAMREENGILRQQLQGAVDAFDSADLLADAIFEGVTQRTLESLAAQYRVARQHAGGQ
jgi:hypothetical protein